MITHNTKSEIVKNVIQPYIQIARIDHWFKNVFVLPGFFLAIHLDSSVRDWGVQIVQLVLVLVIMGLVASSYYILNELLDANTDKYHPVKKFRPIPSGQVNIAAAYMLWLILGVLGIGLSFLFSTGVAFCIIALWIMGCLYNIPPIRTKDKPYLDVLSESLNNPLRFLLGWYVTGTDLIPPISIVLAYWMLGAFFMAAKRYGEYAKIDDISIASAYRKSFAYYNRERLISCMAYYIAAFGLFLGIFIIRYRLELILLVPLVAGFISIYLSLMFKKDSPVQYPEKLYKERGFIFYTGLSTFLAIMLLFVDIPILESWFHKTDPR